MKRQVLPTVRIDLFQKGSLLLPLGLMMVAGWICFQDAPVSSAAQCAPPEQLDYEVVHQIRRSSPGFTEGLVYWNGFLYESTGEYGSSRFQRIRVDATPGSGPGAGSGTGHVDHLAHLSDQEFGEGLANSGNDFYQLTWKEHRLLRWDEYGNFLGDMTYPYEGWGLTRTPEGVWVSSDGTSILHFFNHAPQGPVWAESSSVSVRNGARPETGLNELEFAQGSVYANVFQDSHIVRINPATGCVIGELDLSALVANARADQGANPEWVLNGIAYRPETGTFFVTGKNWSRIYEIRIQKKSAS